MITPQDLEKAAETVHSLWRQDELHILRTAGNHAKKALSGDDDEMFDYLLFEILYGDQHRSNRLVSELFSKASEKLPMTTPESADILTHWYTTVCEDTATATKMAGKNVTGSTAESIAEGKADALEIGSGAALEETVQSIADAARMVEMPDGRKAYISDLIAASFITGMNQAVAAIELKAAEEGDGLVEVSAHRGARPTHQIWQGKVFSLQGTRTINGTEYQDFYEATGYGTGPGLCGWNCRHSFWAKPANEKRLYTDEYLERLKDARAVYDGETVSEYDMQQKLNYLKRQKRTWENREAARLGAGLDTSKESEKLWIYEYRIHELENFINRNFSD